MLPGWASDQVVLTEPVWVDDRGAQVETYPGPGVAVSGCSVQPGAATTDLQMRDNAQILWTAFLPPAEPVTRHARVTWQGEHYQIDGAPQVWKSPLGSLDHIVLPLVRWEG